MLRVRALRGLLTGLRLVTRQPIRCGRCCPREHIPEYQHVSCAKPEGHSGACICDHWLRHKYDGLVSVR